MHFACDERYRENHAVTQLCNHVKRVEIWLVHILMLLHAVSEILLWINIQEYSDEKFSSLSTSLGEELSCQGFLLKHLIEMLAR